jgi:hypothetical protein
MSALRIASGGKPVPEPSDVQQQWSETLAREGSVSFGGRPWPWRREPAIVVDQMGMHLPRTWHLDLSWDQVGDVYGSSRRARYFDVTEDALDGYPQALSWFTRLWFQFSGRADALRRCVIQIRGFGVSADELGGWINALIDERSTIPYQLELDPWPLDSRYPVYGTATGHRVDPTRLPISWDLRNDLVSWAIRGEAEDYLGPSWDAFHEDGGHLAARLRDELGPDYTIGWAPESENPGEPETSGSM